MRLLLDTHVLLWVLSGAEELTPPTRQLIDAADEVFVSSASFWEIAIKTSTGKLAADPARLYAETSAVGFLPLNITPIHALAVSGLPRLHGDPFDRMLIAQAISEPLHLVTHDAVLTRYGAFVTLV